MHQSNNVSSVLRIPPRFGFLSRHSSKRDGINLLQAPTSAPCRHPPPPSLPLLTKLNKWDDEHLTTWHLLLNFCDIHKCDATHESRVSVSTGKIFCQKIVIAGSAFFLQKPVECLVSAYQKRRNLCCTVTVTKTSEPRRVRVTSLIRIYIASKALEEQCE